mgnify:CR=1 FL=1
MDITNEELEKIRNLHNNSVELRNNLENNENQVFPDEYYLINKDWIDNFKNIFHFKGIIGMLTQGNNLQKIGTIPVIKNLPKISQEDKRKIQIIKNGDIMVKPERNESILYCYLNFCFIAPKYYNIITERYNIDKRIKANIHISKKIFIIDLLNNVIEVGIFNTPYSYKIIFLLQYKEGIKYDDEIQRIFECKDIYEYLIKFNITKDMLSKHSDIYRGYFDLIRIYIDENSFKDTSNKKLSDFLKELDITNKLGFKNFGLPQSSKLNSIIQMLTSIKEIYYHFMDRKKEIKEFNHIYIFSSFFLEAINSIYSKNIKQDISLTQMDIVITFLDSDISKKDIVEYLKYILQLLHNELLPIPKNLSQENLISFNSPMEDRFNSLNKFKYYYQNTYQHSIISELFNWIEEKKVNCNNMNFTSSFQAYPLIEFNFDVLFNNLNQNQELIVDINNCFTNYFQVPIKDNPSLPLCRFCNNNHLSNHSIFNTSSYLIIAINRKNLNGIKFKYYKDIDISNFVSQDAQFKKYKLIGVIYEEIYENNNKYYTIIKNEKGGECCENEEWKKFDEQNITSLIINPVNINSTKESFYEVYNQTKARILFYKGIN